MRNLMLLDNDGMQVPDSFIHVGTEVHEKIDNMKSFHEYSWICTKTNHLFFGLWCNFWEQKILQWIHPRTKICDIKIWIYRVL